MFDDYVVSQVANYSRRLADLLGSLNPITVSCAYAGMYELGVAETYVKITTRPLETVGKWLMQDDRVFQNVLAIINQIDPTVIKEKATETGQQGSDS